MNGELCTIGVSGNVIVGNCERIQIVSRSRDIIVRIRVELWETNQNGGVSRKASELAKEGSFCSLS